MRTGVASAVGARRHNENDVTMTIAGLWRYGDWRHVATGCTTLVNVIMAALCNRAGHYIFALWFLLLLLSSIFFYSSPNLSRRKVGVYHTSTHGVASVRI